MTSCAALWPVVVSVLVVTLLFIVLRCVEYWLKRKHKDVKKPKSPLGVEDSLSKQQEPQVQQVEDTTDNFIPYYQHMGIILSYTVLIFIVFCIMIASVVQYFSLSSECYHHLEHTVMDLLLGYQVLAFTSIVVLSIFSCFLVCILLAIGINCCTHHNNR